jgi:phosphate transport system substrate-binding protein
MNPGHKRVNCLFGILVAFLTLTLVACGGPATEPAPTPSVAPRVTLTISGSGTTTSILSAVEPKFEADVPGYNLDVLPGSGTGGGVEGILQDILDAAAMARPPKEEEAAKGVEYVEFGQSGVALYAHPDVGVTDLATAQAKAVLLGEVTNWSQVGGPDQEIILYVRDEGDSSTQALRDAFLGDAPFPETARVLTSQSDMQAAVANTPHSVGFGSWPSALGAGADVRAISLDGIAPSDGVYTIASPVGIGYLAADQATVQPLADWLLSESGQAALGEFGVITTP